MCNERKGDSGRFYAMLFRTKNINRWGLMYNTRHETLADHSYECAVLAHALAVIGNVYFGKNYNADRIASQALLHDMSEMAQAKFLSYLEEKRKAGVKVPAITPKQLHLLMTAYITALFEPVIHNYQYEEAVGALAALEAFFLPGWKQLMGS